MKPKKQFKLVGENITDLSRSSYGQWMFRVEQPPDPVTGMMPVDYYMIKRESVKFCIFM